MSKQWDSSPKYPSDALMRAVVSGKLEPPANIDQAHDVMDRLTDLLNDAVEYVEALRDEWRAQAAEDELRALMAEEHERLRQEDTELGQSIRSTFFGEVT